MTRTVPVSLNRSIDDSYEISIGTGIFKDKVRNTLSQLKPSRIAVVTDTHLFKIYRDLLNVTFGADARIIVYPAGESKKNIRTITGMFAEMQDAGLDRKACVFAFGGGVTGDMAGFLAGIYLRGVRFVQIPTSLLAMVDSSTGGKTGVDTPGGKNLMGVFHQPKAVIIDTDFLKTLPRRDLINGMAEVIKHGIIADSKYFDFIAKKLSKIKKLDGDTLIEMINGSCRIKSSVVSADEKEAGLRQTLNFGHTVGHAVEAASDYRIPHGYAVAIGMAAEAYLSLQRGILSEKEFERIGRVLKAYGLLKYAALLDKMDMDKIIQASTRDKKNEASNTRFVIIPEIGKVRDENGRYSFDMKESELIDALEKVKHM
ncbi:MAG: 3-dehydroquinate synthase [Brevinematales bacterium]|nr:3-dehydroquinate synthase [Brevinematales bacterium]